MKSRIHRVHHLLAHRESRAQTEAGTCRAAAFIRSRDGHRLRHLKLRIAAHIADHVHPDALIQQLLQFFRERNTFYYKAIQIQTQIGKHGS